MATWSTQSRPLLAITMSLVVILLTLDVFLLAIFPQYMTYGGQNYIGCSNSTPDQMYPSLPTPLPDRRTAPVQIQMNSVLEQCEDSFVQVLIPCDWNAPEGQCIMTRISVLWSRLSFKIWYGGALFYWITWIFLAVVMLEATLTMFRSPLVEETSSEDTAEEP